MKAINLQGHNNPVYAVVAHPTLNFCYTAGNDKGIVEWDLENQKFLRLFNPITHTVYTLEIAPTLNLLIAGCSNGHILFFDIESGKLQFIIEAVSAVFCIKYLSHKNELLVSTDNGLIMVININNQKIIHSFQSGNQKIRSFDFNETLNILATASNDTTISLHQLDDYTFIDKINGHALGIGAIAFSPDGKEMITGSRDAHLKIWDTQSWHCKNTIAAHLFAIYQIAYHPYLPYFATCSRDKSIKIWRSNDYSLYKNLGVDKEPTSHKLSVNQIYWLPRGENLVSVSDDKLVKLWQFNG